MALQASLAELDDDEQLFHAVLESSVDESGDLLARMRDVDVRNTSGRTPLYVAVRNGNVDWTEMLLRLGADPLIKDKRDLNALKSAEEMCSKHSDDPDRKEILKLIRLVHDRECLRVENNDGKYTSTKHSDAGLLSSLLFKLWQEMTSSWESVSKQLSEISSKMELPTGSEGTSRPGDMVLLASLLSRLSQDMVSFRQSVIVQLAEISCKTESMTGSEETWSHSDTVLLPSLMSKLSQDMTSFRETGGVQLREISSKIDSLSDQVANLSTPLPSTKEMDEALTKDLSSLKECMKETNSLAFDVSLGVSSARVSLNDLCKELNPSRVDGLGSTQLLKSADREETKEGIDAQLKWSQMIKRLVDAMMKRTIILNVDAIADSSCKVGQCYEKLLSLSDETRSLVFFILFKTKVQVFIDCASDYVGGMKGKLRNLDGIEDDGNKYVLFTDFEEGKIYIGGTRLRYSGDITVFTNLTLCLAEMSIFHVFRNEGRPYAEVDKEHQVQYRNIVDYVEKNRKTPWDFDAFINGALTWTTPRAREIVLIASVPAMIAKHGLERAKSSLRKQLPHLSDFYSNHVLPNQSHLLMKYVIK